MGLINKYAEMSLNDVGINTKIVDDVLYEVKDGELHQVLKPQEHARSWVEAMKWRPLNVLVACERSGIIRRAFEELGHHAVSVDIVSDEEGSDNHYCGDAIQFMIDNEYRNPNTGDLFDVLIATPPYDYIDVSETRWFSKNAVRQEVSVGFVKDLYTCNIPHKLILLPNTIINKNKIISNYNIITPGLFGDTHSRPLFQFADNLPFILPPKENLLHKTKYNLFKKKQNETELTQIASHMAQQITDHFDNLKVNFG